ncbi:hypothetical protein MMSR116_21725 [Methylobacterium mesophilicum SR1.6/6]|uniref:Transposase n=1 Tax=Methylobacterium mesophilicum SR1.6/6 TaxID=908290 RepID=A0A6B9FPB4_9HYPH|nr:hypothetical protein MMSR116_21725 [Methylobacterium mesophilicum SR1.6/6]
MMGPRQVEQGALFYEFSLDTHVPVDNLLRASDRFVDLSDQRPHGLAIDWPGRSQKEDAAPLRAFRPIRGHEPFKPTLRHPGATATTAMPRLSVESGALTRSTGASAIICTGNRAEARSPACVRRPVLPRAVWPLAPARAGCRTSPPGLSSRVGRAPVPWRLEPSRAIGRQTLIGLAKLC